MAQQLILKTCKIPALGAQEQVRDPIVHVKLFTPMSGWTWLLTEYDPEEDLAFGFAYNSQHADGAELGYVSLAELKELRVRGIPAVERDIHFTAKPLSQAKQAECPGVR